MLQVLEAWGCPRTASSLRPKQRETLLRNTPGVIEGLTRRGAGEGALHRKDDQD